MSFSDERNYEIGDENDFRTNVLLPFCRMITYTSNHSEKDGLVVGVTPSENPFRDQKGCAIL